MSKPGELKQVWNKDKRCWELKLVYNKETQCWETTLRGKYEDEYRGEDGNQLTLLTALEAHALGTKTYSYTIDRDGMARSGVIDPDEGGTAVLRALLRILANDGMTAYAVAMNTPNGHNGGHIRVEFDQLLPNEQIENYLRDVARRADVADWRKIEVWPGNNQGVRGPLGKHQLTGSRGTGITRQGEYFNLDEAAELAAFVEIIIALQPNAPPPAPVPVEPPIITSKPSPVLTMPVRRVSLGEQGAKQLNDANTIGEYNRTNKLSNQLAFDKGAQLHICPCGGHSSRKGKIAIWTGSDGVERGQSYSPDCLWFPTFKNSNKHYLDSFGYFALSNHGGDRSAALKALNPLSEKRNYPPHPAEAIEYRTLAQVQDAQRKRQQRQEAAKQWQEQRQTWADAQTERLANDPKACDTYRATWTIHYVYFASKGEHTVSVARMAADLCNVTIAEGVHTRKLQRANKWLVEHGYLEYTKRCGDGRQHTNIWKPAKFQEIHADADALRASGLESPRENARDVLDHDLVSDLLLESRACEPGAIPTQPASDAEVFAAFDAYEPASEWDANPVSLFELSASIAAAVPATGGGSQALSSVAEVVLVEAEVPASECASFDRIAAKAHAVAMDAGMYTGIGKDRMPPWEVEHWMVANWERNKPLCRLPVVDQQTLQVPASSKSQKSPKVKYVRFREEVASDNEIELANKLQELRGTLENGVQRLRGKKGDKAAENWATTLREKIAIVEAAIDCFEQRQSSAQPGAL